MVGKKKAVISDMDGVLVNSFDNFYLAYKRILDEKGAKDFNRDYYRQYFGAKADYTKQAIERDFNVDLGSDEDFMKEKDKYYMENALKSTTAFIEPVEAIKQLASMYRIAVATSSEEQILNHSLKTIGLYDYIEVGVPGNMVKKGKPAPDIFLLASEKLGIPTDNCLVIEDSVPGMNASYKAGIKCICIIADGVDAKKYDKALEVLRMSEITANTLIHKVKLYLGS
jgi:beta-phosphoglucomutase